MSVPRDQPVAAVIDIGSNSVRLVAFRADRRTPITLFNEKVMAGLGAGVAEAGDMADENMESALDALARFSVLCQDMAVERLDVFATAAVREAANGPAFCAKVQKRCGFEIDVLSGEEEARYAALGVAAGIRGVGGIVGDLGGGSLELVHVENGVPGDWTSLPIGALKLAELRKAGTDKMRRKIKKALTAIDWAGEGEERPFYMVGGSWRALAQLHMHLIDHPLKVVHQYELSLKAVDRMARAIPNLSMKRLRGIDRVTSSRVPHLPGATLLLRQALKKLGSSHAVASAYGVREGLFYSRLPAELRRRDPLISAAQEEGEAEGRFPHHGGALMRWMDGLFADDSAEQRRLRRVAAELSDVAWRAHPDFRAERALEVALHGNWVGIDGPGRAMLGAALFAVFGGGTSDMLPVSLARLAPFEALDRASAWGLALRLGQRLTGGTADPLGASLLTRKDDKIVLEIDERYRDLFSPVVETRLQALATHMALRYTVKIC